MIKIKRTISVMIGKGSVNHNSRKFTAENVDRERTKNNIDYCNRDIKEVYHELFDDAVKRFNNKQKRDDRKITNYYEKICSSKQETEAFNNQKFSYAKLMFEKTGNYKDAVEKAKSLDGYNGELVCFETNGVNYYKRTLTMYDDLAISLESQLYETIYMGDKISAAWPIGEGDIIYDKEPLIWNESSQCYRVINENGVVECEIKLLGDSVDITFTNENSRFSAQYTKNN